MELSKELQQYAENVFRRFPEVFVSLGAPDVEDSYELHPCASGRHRIVDFKSKRVIEIVLPRRGGQSPVQSEDGYLSELEWELEEDEGPTELHEVLTRSSSSSSPERPSRGEPRLPALGETDWLQVWSGAPHVGHLLQNSVRVPHQPFVAAAPPPHFGPPGRGGWVHAGATEQRPSLGANCRRAPPGADDVQHPAAEGAWWGAAPWGAAGPRAPLQACALPEGFSRRDLPPPPELRARAHQDSYQPPGAAAASQLLARRAFHLAPVVTRNLRPPADSWSVQRVPDLDRGAHVGCSSPGAAIQRAAGQRRREEGEFLTAAPHGRPFTDTVHMGHVDHSSGVYVEQMRPGVEPEAIEGTIATFEDESPGSRMQRYATMRRQDQAAMPLAAQRAAPDLGGSQALVSSANLLSMSASPASTAWANSTELGNSTEEEDGSPRRHRA